MDVEEDESDNDEEEALLTLENELWEHTFIASKGHAL